MTQDQFNEEVLDILLELVAELDLQRDISDNSYNDIFAKIRQLGRAMGFADFLKRDDLGYEIDDDIPNPP
jgi:hypothetical protein